MFCVPAISKGKGTVTKGGGAAPAVPVNTVLPAISGPNNPPQVGDTLTATNGTWTGEPSEFAYVWQRNAGEWSTIPDAALQTYEVVFDDDGAIIRVQVTAANGSGSSDPAFSEATSTVIDPPQNQSSPTIAGNEINSTSEVTDVGTWTGSPDTFTYQWFLSGVPLGGETASTWSIAGSSSEEFYCEVTAHNADGASLPIQSNVLTCVDPP
jgi:hypothetical protein